MSRPRPDPDELLKRVQREEAKQSRGRLKIFFGACAGVGKTFAMLTAAQSLRREGKEVVVGIVETHGRPETEALLAGLEVLPARRSEYKGTLQKEFDLEGALKRRPSLILVDELAHTNLTDSRHPKRWQDVEELLDSGIDVFTTLNVQHLESLNDVVGRITGIRVRETLPDRVFEQADEVALVDLTPDELLARLLDGKVYVSDQASLAARNFFRKGNLIALRELALRRTADRVDLQMRVYREDQAIRPIWQAKERLLVCVGPGPGMEKLIREASRLATGLLADWHAAYVETPALQRLPGPQRLRNLEMAKLAQELGAETITLSAPDPAEALVEYARRSNLTRVVLGRDRTPWWRIWPPNMGDRIGRLAPDLDVVLIGLEPRPEEKQPAAPVGPVEPARSDSRPVSWKPYAWMLGACAVTTLVASLLSFLLDLTNIAMLFLLTVGLVAFRFGRRPGVFASILCVALFDFFFVPPRLTFAVSDVQYLLTFAVMLAVALVIAHLTSSLRYQARVASHRERRTRVLYEMGRELSAALTPGQIVEICDRYSENTFRGLAAILLPDEHDRIQPPGPDTSATPNPAVDMGIAQWVFEHGRQAGFGTDTLPGTTVTYVPLKAPQRTRGVLALEPSDPRLLLVPEQRQLLEIFATQIGIALERVHYADVAQQAIVRIQSEKLRNSLLNALSHDLRTPVTSVLGLAESLPLTRPPLSAEQREIVDTIRNEAERMSTLMNNLLEMARLESGEVRLNRQWQGLEDLVGSALGSRRQDLEGHRVRVEIPPGLPLVEADSVLMERVFSNLLENAVKYAPPGSEIRIEAGSDGRDLKVAVLDEGPGIPEGMLEAAFEKFTRGQGEARKPGVGLGLAICRAIVEAHGGRIWAENREGGGARLVFTLPLGRRVEPSVPVESPGERLSGAGGSG